MDGTFRVSNLVLIMLSITDAVARRECRDVIRAPACLCWWPSGEVLKRCSTWRRTRPKRHTARHLAATQRCLPGPHTHTSRDTVLRSQTAGYSLHYSIDVKMFFFTFFWSGTDLISLLIVFFFFLVLLWWLKWHVSERRNFYVRTCNMLLTGPTP